MLLCLKCGRFCSSLTSAVNEWRISEASVIGKLHFYSLLCTVLRRQGVEIPFESSAGREVIWSKVILVPESACGTRVRKIGKCLTHHDTMIPGSAVLIQVLPAKQFGHRHRQTAFALFCLHENNPDTFSFSWSKGLASYCKADTTITFYFSIINA